MVGTSVVFCFLQDLFHRCATRYEVTVNADIPTLQDLCHLTPPFADPRVGVPGILRRAQTAVNANAHHAGNAVASGWQGEKREQKAERNLDLVQTPG